MDIQSVEEPNEAVQDIGEGDIAVQKFGEYITQQSEVLNKILGFLSYDELNNVQLVCREWLIAIKMMRQKQNHFMTTKFYCEPIHYAPKKVILTLAKIKLHTGCFSLLSCNDFFKDRYIFKKLYFIEIINDHLLEIHNYKDFRIFYGNHLPPININNIYHYHNHTDISSVALTIQRISSKLQDISIHQCVSGFNTNNLKQFLTNLKKPIKGIMVFDNIQSLDSFHFMDIQKVIQEIQDEPFTMIGGVLDYNVLLPTSIKYHNKADFHCTFVVFSGDLRVSSIKLYKDALSHNNFEHLISDLYNKAGICPLNNTRIIYIFFCIYSGKWEKPILDFLSVKFPNVELVIIGHTWRSIYFDSLHKSELDIIDLIALTISVFDFEDCSYQCKYEDLLR